MLFYKRTARRYRAYEEESCSHDCSQQTACLASPLNFARADASHLGRKASLTILKTTFLRIKYVAALLAAMFVGVVPQLCTQTKAADHQEHIQRIEAKAVDLPLQANEPPLQLSLKKLMELYKIPALSMAVIENYKIVWAKAYGVTDVGTSKSVTTKTLFQAGSISKPVAAVGALSLVEKGQLALDESVNQKLKSWKVPENEFTKTEKVSLRRILSHTAGLTVHGFPGYDVDAPLPTLVQILNGEKPANTEPIRVDIVPGTQERYSGGGVTIEQQLVMDVTGKPFPEFMRANVLEKVGMTDSSYEQPLPHERASRTAAGSYADGKAVHGRWHIYPEMAAAGLWTTPTDLAKFAIEVALSKHGRANHVLSEAMTKTMLTPVMAERSTERHGWDQSQEFAAVISWPDVSVLPLIVLVASPGAMPPRHRTAGSRVRHDGVRRLPKSLPAIPHGSAVHTLAGRHKESPSFGKSPSADSSPASNRELS
jgi:CubicO group peptidase (beta-lactamase class C family)